MCKIRKTVTISSEKCEVVRKIVDYHECSFSYIVNLALKHYINHLKESGELERIEYF